MRLFRLRSRSLAVLLLALVTLLPITGRTQEATPGIGFGVPDPALCTVEPRPIAFFAQFAGTPTAEQAAQQTAMEVATPVTAFQLPEGEPADPETVAGVLDTLQRLGACLNAGALLSYAALFTDDYWQREIAQFGPPPAEELAFLSGTPQALPAEARVGLLAILDVRELPNGRVAGLFDVTDPFETPPGPARFSWVFVEQDGRWLIDEQVMLGPIAADQVGTPMP